MDERVRYIPCRLTSDIFAKKFQHYSSLWSNVLKITSFWGHFFKVLSKCICHLSLSFCWSVNFNYLHHHGSGECPHSDIFVGNVWSSLRPLGGDAPTEYSFFLAMDHGIRCNMFPVVGIGTFHIQSGKSHKRSPFCPMGPRQPAWEVKGSMAEAGKQILLLL